MKSEYTEVHRGNLELRLATFGRDWQSNQGLEVPLPALQLSERRGYATRAGGVD